MIEAMKAVTVVCLASERERALDGLRELGILHVQLTDGESKELSAAQVDLDRIRRTVDVLEAASTGKEPDFMARALTIFDDFDPLDLADQVKAVDEENEWTREELAGWESALEQLKPWGDTDPALLDSLREQGLVIRTCSSHHGEVVELPDHAVRVDISQDDRNVYFVLLSDRPIEVTLNDVQIPAKSRAELEANVEACRDRLGYRQHSLEVMAGFLPRLRQSLDEQRDQVDFLAARGSMGDAEQLAWLHGYAPAPEVDRLRAAADKHGWALLVEDPDADDKNVPTKIILPKWLDVSRPIFDFIGIRPGYHEFDISAWFLLFLAIFFALLVGDGGYGILLLLGAGIAKLKAPKNLQVTLNLLLIFGASTTIWGVLTGNYFGIPFEKLPGFMQAAANDWLMGGLKTLVASGTANADNMAAAADESMKHVELLCFMLGALHLSLAHAWKALLVWNSPRILGQLGWIAVLWGNFFLAIMLVCNYPLNPATMPLFITGGILILLFTEPSMNPFKSLGNGLASILSGGINSFVDVLSYIRLFAVGMASYFVAVNFNEMGVGLFAGGIIGILAGCVAILLGHLVNVTLCALGVLVHGVRLNTLEFSGHIGIEWAGILFRPFRRRVAAGSSETD